RRRRSKRRHDRWANVNLRGLTEVGAAIFRAALFEQRAIGLVAAAEIHRHDAGTGDFGGDRGDFDRKAAKDQPVGVDDPRLAPAGLVERGERRLRRHQSAAAGTKLASLPPITASRKPPNKVWRPMVPATPARATGRIEGSAAKLPAPQ